MAGCKVINRGCFSFRVSPDKFCVATCCLSHSTLHGVSCNGVLAFMLQELGDVDKRLRLLQEAAAVENPLLALKQLNLGKAKGAIHLGYVRALQVCRGEH